LKLAVFVGDDEIDAAVPGDGSATQAQFNRHSVGVEPTLAIGFIPMMKSENPDERRQIEPAHVTILSGCQYLIWV
jgi:hypothetical protein